MPSRTKKVRFETEYNSSFKAFDEDVYRSPLIEALVDEPLVRTIYGKNEKVAGLQSHRFSKSVEPPLQHRRYVANNNDDPGNIEEIADGKKDNSDVSSFAMPAKIKKNRALEFKAGLRPESSLTKIKKHPVSEYKRQYEWKKSPNDSPLLNAEKIVFDSHTNIPRFVRDKVPHRTEYQTKFAAEKPRKLRCKEENENGNVKEKDTPSSAVKRLLQTSQNPDTPFSPHGSNRVYHTEYQANFGSPKKYKYQEGIWLGAKPAHFLPDAESTQESTEGLPNWFEEVLELRTKAKQYKIRAQEGNYFSREFLAKLDGELEEMYGEHGDSNDSRNGKRFGEEGSERSKRSNDSAVPARTVHVKQAWESDTSNSDDGRNVYKNLNEQFKRDSSDIETLSSRSDDKHVDDNESIGSGSPPLRKNKERNNQHPGKTFTKKPSRLATTVVPRTSKRNPPLLQDNTSGSEASSERSEESGVASCSANNANALNIDLKNPKPTPRINSVNPDTFNVETIRRIQSNDVEDLSSSVQSIYGSADSDKLRKNEYDSQSDCMSECSFAGRKSLARHTLSLAKQRDAKFWKK